MNRTPPEERRPTRLIEGVPLPDGYGVVEAEDEHQFITVTSGQERREADALTGLSTLNIFVGANNSGKSRLLRELFRTTGEDERLIRVSDPPAIELSERASEVAAHALKLFEALATRRLLERRPEILTNGGETLNQLVGLAKFTSVGDLRQIGKLVASAKSYVDNARRLAGTPAASELFEKHKVPFEEFENALKRLDPQLGESSPRFKKVYIPALRTTRPVEAAEDSEKTPLIALARRTYFAGDPRFQARPARGAEIPATRIHTGEDLVCVVRSSLLGHPPRRQMIADYQKFLSQTFFENAPVTLIPKEDPGNELYVRIGEEEHAIYDLGDGIQQIIILTFPLFQHRDDDLLLFVEEPELYLHHGMQRTLIDTILRRGQGGDGTTQVFATTHSSQFLDITLDEQAMAVFRVSKRTRSKAIHDAADAEVELPTFDVECIASDKRAVLRDLGVRNSSVLLTNCTIWVEGITDRMYLRRALRLVQEKEIERDPGARRFQEDTHYSFVEYGGSNITHWSFLNQDGIDVDRLCGRLFLVADRDEAKPGSQKAKRHKALKKVLRDRYARLKCREIENLLSERVLVATVAAYEGICTDELAQYANLDFTRDDYKSVPLGRFIDERILNGRCAETGKPVRKGKRRRAGPYAARGGTIQDKVGFAEHALKHIQQASDLSREAEDLAKRIRGFIADHNEG